MKVIFMFQKYKYKIINNKINTNSRYNNNIIIFK